MSMRERSSPGGAQQPAFAKAFHQPLAIGWRADLGQQIAGISARAKAQSGSAHSSGPTGRHDALAAFSSYVVLCKSESSYG